MNEPKKSPVDRVRDGRLSASIWENKDQNGVRRYSVSFEKSYTVETEQGHEWRQTQSFSERDLLALGKLMERAYERIGAMKDQEKTSYRERAQRDRRPRRDADRDR